MSVLKGFQVQLGAITRVQFEHSQCTQNPLRQRRFSARSRCPIWCADRVHGPRSWDRALIQAGFLLNIGMNQVWAWIAFQRPAPRRHQHARVGLP